MSDGHCVECGEEFHLDDTGGYNPPCQCCGLCRSCCAALRSEEEEWDDDGEDVPAPWQGRGDG